MKIEIKVPAMGESIAEATVGELLKSSGSPVSMDDEILELETDKVNQVLYAPKSGTLTWNIQKGDVVTIGQLLGFIDTSVIEPQTAKKEPSAEATPMPPPQATPPKTTPEAITETSSSLKETEKGIRIAKEAFVQELLNEPETSSALRPPSLPASEERSETRRKMTRIRQVIAKRLVEAQRNSAMLTSFNEVDMSQIIALREKYKEIFTKEYEARLGFMSFFVKATVKALMSFPGINSYIDGDEIVHREYYDIGIAVSTERGLIVPVVRNCDRLSFAEIEKQIESFAKKARDGSLNVSDLQGGGFTITNGGVYGSLLSTPILNPPQSGILGMHKILKRPVAIGDQIAIRPMMYIALSYDHRIVDGKEAVLFLVKIKESLEDPGRLLLDV
jgi:2-oxoglutarate dehydrogenase E2 component (dihydrolipoamide succinyltransferase)